MRSSSTVPRPINREFVDKYCVFATGYADIGYGLRDKIDHPKYKTAELDTAGKEAVKVLTNEEATALGYLNLKAGDKLEMKHAGDGRRTLAHRVRGLQKGTGAVHARLRGRAREGGRGRADRGVQKETEAAGGPLY